MIKKYEITGKQTGVGAFEDGCILCMEPAYTEESRTKAHWTHIYYNVDEKAIVVEWGNSRNGSPFASVAYADGSRYTGDDAADIVESVAGEFYALEM